MDPATLIGFTISLVALIFFMILEGADPTSLIFLPAIVLVVVATFGAAAASRSRVNTDCTLPSPALEFLYSYR